MMSDALTFHTSFSSDDFEAQYNLRQRRPDFEQTVTPDWQRRSQHACEHLNNRLDLRYGKGEKQKLDVFLCGDSTAPTLVYIHGGYWHRGDKSLYSFLADPFVAHEVNVVVIGYDLCPAVTLTQISEQAREAIAWIWRNAADIGLNRERLSVMGHSAGGHLTQMLMATDWSVYSEGLPLTLLVAGVPISPVSYLEPVRLTNSLNDFIRMTAEEAERESPMINHPPATLAPQLVIVGGGETAEFLRQAKMYVDAFHSHERTIELYVVPEVDHFDELNVLADQDGELFNKVLTLISS